MEGEKKILVLGAGRSSSSLIRYLLDNSEINNWKVRVADTSFDLAQQKINQHSKGEALLFDVHNENQRRKEIENSDLVISLLPPPFHFIVAQTCVELSKHLLTASYVSNEIESLNKLAVEKDILILMETGLDPGIDHMSSMKEIENIQLRGGELFSFKSFTGGLIAPESDNNPWHYKITWNPRNVVLAGKGISKYLEDDEIKELAYENLFTHLEKINVEEYGEFEGYANRDSLKYLETYQLKNIQTFLRGTLRRPGFSKAWNILVRIGMTDDSFKVKDSLSITYRALLEYLIKDKSDLSLEDKLLKLGDVESVDKIKWLGLLSEEKIGIADVSPADILQKVIENKLKLQANDKDMIVMQHQFEFKVQGKNKKLTSSLVVKGENEFFTAMAKTVGLPLGIAAKLLLQDKITLRGVQIPVTKEIYEPILMELEENGIIFYNEEVGL